MFTDFSALIIVSLVAKFRNSIPFLLKAYFLLFIFYLLVLVEILRLGVLSENNVLMILIPFIAILALSRRQFWIINILTLLAYGVVAYFFLTNQIPSDYPLYNSSLTNWISRLTMLSIVAFVVLVIFNQFNKKYLQIIGELTAGNEQLKKNELELNIYKDQLQHLVDKRTEELTTKVEELKKTQLQLLQSEKMASLGVLSAGVGHEINNPLNFISNGFEAIKNNLGEAKSAPGMDHYIAAVEEGVKRISRIVKGLSQYSRNDEGLIQECDLKEITENCLLLLNKQLVQKIDVTMNFTNGHQLVMGNLTELHQVVGNILFNAIEAIVGDGEISINSNIINGELVLIIGDNGIGIKEEHLTKVLDPFFTTKPAGSGTGLGLAICTQIMKKHSGKMEIESEYGNGTKVTISFPLLKK
jgi:signal transduction histidine kinase